MVAMKKILIYFVLLCIFFSGCDRSAATDFVEIYNFQVTKMCSEEISLQKDLLCWYNLNLHSEYPDVGFERKHRDILNIADGMIGYVEIPALDQQIPIFHDLRENAFCLNAYDYFPSGREGEVPELCTELPLVLQNGDVFSIIILDEVFTYQVGGEGNASCELICDGACVQGTRIVED